MSWPAGGPLQTKTAASGLQMSDALRRRCFFPISDLPVPCCPTLYTPWASKPHSGVAVISFKWRSVTSSIATAFGQRTRVSVTLRPSAGRAHRRRERCRGGPSASGRGRLARWGGAPQALHEDDYLIGGRPLPNFRLAPSTASGSKSRTTGSPLTASEIQKLVRGEPTPRPLVGGQLAHFQTAGGRLTRFPRLLGNCLRNIADDAYRPHRGSPFCTVARHRADYPFLL